MTTSQKDLTPRVVGAGFGRTGTASLKRALEILGFGPCHHMAEVIKHPAEVPTWEAAARGEKIDWRAFLRGWGSTVDFPSALYYRELMEAFPETKVILTVRDSSAWYESMKNTIVPMLTRFPNRYVLVHLPYIGGAARSMRGTSLRADLLGRFDERAHAIKLFEEHSEEVRRVVVAERLLVFQVAEGWEPLCKFLGVPVPDAPFPRENDTAAFRRRVVASTVISWVVLLVPISFALALARWLLRGLL
jgi:hypothetical protein